MGTSFAAPALIHPYIGPLQNPFCKGLLGIYADSSTSNAPLPPSTGRA